MNFGVIRSHCPTVVRLRPAAIHTLTTATDRISVSTLGGNGCYRALLMPQMDRRRMMLTAGIGVLAAALPVPEARAYPPRQVPEVPPPAAPSGQAGSYIFQDEFDGPAGSAPDPSQWAVAKARETVKDPT